MKKIAVVLIILSLVATSAFASFIQLGPTGRFTPSNLTDIEAYKDPANYNFGIDCRINLGVIDVAANALYSGDLNTAHHFDTFASANFRMDLSLIEFALGAGVNVGLGNVDEYGQLNADEKWTINYQDFSETLNIIQNSQIFLRAAAGVNLGGLGASVAYSIPVETAVAYLQGEGDDIGTLNQGKVAVSLLLNIF